MEFLTHLLMLAGPGLVVPAAGALLWTHLDKNSAELEKQLTSANSSQRLLQSTESKRALYEAVSAAPPPATGARLLPAIPESSGRKRFARHMRWSSRSPWNR